MAANNDAAALSKQRRRLSVQSDSKFIEGVENMDISGGGKARRQSIQIREGEAGSHISRLFGLSKKGYAPYNPRKKNQDALAMAEDPATATQAILVLDGHGEAGDLVSGYYKEKYLDEVFAHAAWPGDVEGMKRVATCCSSSSASSSGTRPWTRNHKPDAPAEKARILGAGGRVFAVEYDDGVDGPPRVWLGHMDVPGLAMSRSVGDVVAHAAGVSTEPEFFVHPVSHEDRFLVSATDGLWEFLTDDEVVAMVAKVAMETGSPKACVEALVEESNARWMKNEQVIDDTTIAVAFLSADLVAAATNAKQASLPFLPAEPRISPLPPRFVRPLIVTSGNTGAQNWPGCAAGARGGASTRPDADDARDEVAVAGVARVVRRDLLRERGLGLGSLHACGSFRLWIAPSESAVKFTRISGRSSAGGFFGAGAGAGAGAFAFVSHSSSPPSATGAAGSRRAVVRRQRPAMCALFQGLQEPVVPAADEPKIKEVRAFVLRPKPPPEGGANPWHAGPPTAAPRCPAGAVVVEVEQDDGLVGVGCTVGGEAVCVVVEEHLAKFVEGQSARNIAHAWDRCWRGQTAQGRRGLGLHALSAVDLALWDLLGKITGEPCHVLLGA
ncbi:protein serine/threonine phosphatase [Aureococcus anophagefferens]|nr:protein serine/threonine phosphatase [Aureococcus anophagefferens]